MRKIPCPFLEDGSFIGLPDRWLGKHAARRDATLELLRTREKKYGDTFTRFSIAMALLEEWSLPGLMGNPEQWDLERIDLTVIAWVSIETLSDFLACLASPAAYSKRSGNGPATSTIPTPSQPGSSESNELPGN